MRVDIDVYHDMMRDTSRNIVANALRPGYVDVMARKVVGRFGERRSTRNLAATRRWLDAHAENSEEFIANISTDLALESARFTQASTDEWLEILGDLSVDLGGGADYQLLYFLTRFLRPNVVIETGVAAGYSSASILSALRANGDGHLYSSDFPYFRLRDPEEFVGILVHEELRERWTLDVSGDRKALPRFAKMVDIVNLFHYDSDKTFKGRQYALDVLSSVFTDDTIIVFDDIGDNDHFRRFVEADSSHFHVFAIRGKHVGLVSRFCIPFH